MILKMLIGIICLCALLHLSNTLDMASDNCDLVERLAAIEQRMDLRILNQEEIIRTLQTEVRDLKQELATEKRSKGNIASHRSRRAHSVNVAFSSYLDHQVNHVGIDSIIPYNKVIFNDGGAFNNVTGIFSAPVSGVYLFTYTLNARGDVQLIVKLVIDGVNVSDGISDPNHVLQDMQGGNTVLVRVQQGQSVWLAAYNTDNTMVTGRDEYRFTTFSGVLLYT